MTPVELGALSQLPCYGSFRLTDAVRPGPGLSLAPREGYRIEKYRNRSARLRIPVLSASVSRERLFEIFLRLLEPLGDQWAIYGSPQVARLAPRHLLGGA